MCQHSLFAWASTLGFSYIRGEQDWSAGHPVKCSVESCFLFWGFFFPFFILFFLLEEICHHQSWEADGIPRSGCWDPPKLQKLLTKPPVLGGKISNSRCDTGTPLPKVLFPTLSLTKPSLFLKPPEPNRPDFCTFCVLLVFALCFWMTAWCEAALFSGKQSCHCLVHVQLLPEPWKLHVASLLRPDNSTSIAWAII